MKRPKTYSDRGQALVEFILVLPILLVIVLAVIQFGTLYNSYETITNATRAGARAAAVSRTSDPSGAATQAVYDSASNLDQGQLGVSVSGSWTPGGQVTVTVTYPYSIDLLGFVVQAGTLSSSTKERVE